MKQFSALGCLLVVVLAFATFGNTAAENFCTPETCIGPVRVEFTSNDCSGAPVFYEASVQYGVCDGSSYNEESEEGVAYYYFYSQNCDRTAANASFAVSFYKWGACLPNIAQARSTNGQRAEISAMSGTYMYLAGVNDSYVSPQTFDNQPIQAYSGSMTACYGVDNCTLPNGEAALNYITSYDSSPCEDPYYSQMNTQELGVCTNYYNLTYTKSGCFDPKGAFTAYYSDAACTRPVHVSAYRTSCTGNYQEQHCNAPVTRLPIGPEAPSDAPTGSAQSFQLSALAILVALMAFSFF
jgi:hypothetical protein